MAEEWKNFYKSWKWQKVAEQVRKRDAYTCQLCGAVGSVYVHHKQELTKQNVNDPSIALNPDNLMTLCRNCHEQIHNRQIKRYKVLENGEVICKR